jgi:apolipoprotein N-acyltransferase
MPLLIRLRPWLLSLTTGLALIAAFPNFNLEFLAWVALAPLLAAIDRAPGMGRAAALGFVSGFVFFAGTHYWIRLVMLNYGGLGQATAALVYVAFAAVLGLFFAGFAVLARPILRLPAGLLLGGLPALWVAFELARAHLLTGLPFLLLGYAVAGHLLLAQLARFGGVYLLSFVVALFNAGVLLLIREPRNRKRGMWLVAALFALALLTLGAILLPTPPAPETAYLVQAQAMPEERWTIAETHRLMAELEQRVLAAWARNQARAGLVLFPEIPASLYYYDDQVLRAQLERLARNLQSPVLVNAIAFAGPSRDKPYNSALLVGPEGELEGRYDKIHLVPFGEYVPWRKLFSFAGKITAEVGDFAPGTAPVVLGKGRKLGPLICYEEIFPELVRRFTARGAQVLVNISNDAWYGDSAARDQLLLMARLRAVENGRWLLRATNTGITAAIDPYGRVRASPPDRRAVYPVHFGYLTGETPYVAFGHWFPVACAIAASLLLIGSLKFKVSSLKLEDLEF